MRGKGGKVGRDMYLDERLGALEEVLPALRLRALLVPVDDGLV